jgi:hypothetical protein
MRPKEARKLTMDDAPPGDEWINRENTNSSDSINREEEVEYSRTTTVKESKGQDARTEHKQTHVVSTRNGEDRNNPREKKEREIGTRKESEMFVGRVFVSKLRHWNSRAQLKDG